MEYLGENKHENSRTLQKDTEGKPSLKTVYLRDNRPASIQKKALQSGVGINVPASSPKANNTGLPNSLKSGVENLSGISMDDVKVHYNSPKPAQLQAHAYAQGNQIHLAPGQEKHLPHEAWHLVQQKQGRVKATMQMKSGVNVNDDKGLESEADEMGKKALQRQFNPAPSLSPQIDDLPSVKNIVQRVIIDKKNVSPEVLRAFNGLNPWVKLLFWITPKIPGFFEMSDEKKVQYFQGMNMAMPILQQMIQVQQGAGLIAHKPVSPDQSMLDFIKINATLISKSISLFNGGGASLNFHNPKGIMTVSVSSLRALMPPKPSQIGAAPDTAQTRHLALLPPKALAKPAGKSAEELEAERFIALDATEEETARPLLIAALNAGGVKVPKDIDFRKLEIMHASYLYQRDKTSLGKKPSMKVFPPGYDLHTTQIDKMRQAQHQGGPQTGIDKLLAPLMPQLIEVSKLIRLTNYFDSNSEASILASGRLQSKERRRIKAPKDLVISKSSKTDNELGNTDHVFFFAEFVGAKFRKTRFSGTADEEDTVLSERHGLDGTERRISFPLNAMDPRGMHGYVEDIGSKGVNPIEKVFSGTPPAGQHGVGAEGDDELKTERKESKKVVTASAATSSGSMSSAGMASDTVPLPHGTVVPPPPGVHLLMDLLRQRFKKTNFPPSVAKKGEGAMVSSLLKMNSDPKAFYTFLFRKHPDVKTDTDINPQILVPGSVPFSTPGFRLERPSKEEVDASNPD